MDLAPHERNPSLARMRELRRGSGVVDVSTVRLSTRRVWGGGRVLNAGRSDAKLYRIVNPYKQWRDRSVGVCFTL